MTLGDTNNKGETHLGPRPALFIFLIFLSVFFLLLLVITRRKGAITWACCGDDVTDTFFSLLPRPASPSPSFRSLHTCILLHLDAQEHALDKAFLGVVSIYMGSFYDPGSSVTLLYHEPKNKTLMGINLTPSDLLFDL